MTFGSFRTRDVALPLLKGCAVSLAGGAILLLVVGTLIGGALRGL